jgi:UDP-N-acetylglucosamine--N-acetylmuramyl-(pentapeptide) pyrophosphoryl-undecaprenol N-acetylglucosamine transferase
MGIPTCVHEANAMPGLTTRMAAAWADRVLICFPESAKHYKNPEKAKAVGMPVRKDFIEADKAAARAALGLDSRPLIVSTFGSQGARAMNLVTADLLKLEQEAGFPWQHIHGVGSFGWEWFPEKLKELGVDASSLDIREYIYNMPQLMAAADLVICRAGASTLSEICASGTASIIVPSPNVTNDHQDKNARVLERRGAAVVIRETECDGDSLYETVKALLQDREKLREMGVAAAKTAVVDSAEQIYAVIRELAQ